MQGRSTCNDARGCPAVAKRKAPGLLSQVRGSETLDISYSHLVTNPVRVLSMCVALTEEKLGAVFLFGEQLQMSLSSLFLGRM